MIDFKKYFTKKNLIDQSSHVAAATVFFLPFLLAPCALTAALATGGYGVVREVTEEGNPVTWAKVKAALSGTNSLIDVAFWSLTGAVLYTLFA